LKNKYRKLLGLILLTAGATNLFAGQPVESFELISAQNCFGEVCDYSYEMTKMGNDYKLLLFNFDTYLGSFSLVKTGLIHQAVLSLPFDSAQQQQTRDLYFIVTFLPDGMLNINIHALRDIVDTNLAQWRTATLVFKMAN